ncbi:MAG TPA: alkaline phosphatase family protein, partial [Chloroflexota bacterium]
MGRFAPSLLVRLALLATAILPMGAGARSDDAAAAPAPINHVIVIYMENHSFDNLYGYFPGAEGLSRASIAGMQIGEDGKHDANLPRVVEAGIGLKLVDQRFPELINQPFDIGRYVGLTSRTTDLVHRFYQEQMQINGGKMDRFAAVSDAGGLTMGHYDGSQLPLWSYALRYTLADHFFHAAFGGSMLNHFWLVCACTPTFPDAPADLRARVDAEGNMMGDGAVTPDGYVVNNLESANSPHRASTPTNHLVPMQTAPHIGDRLDAAGLSWAWYGGGWSESLAGRMTPYSTYITEPFAYFANMADGTEGRARHLKDEEDFLPELASGFLP